MVSPLEVPKEHQLGPPGLLPNHNGDDQNNQVDPSNDDPTLSKRAQGVAREPSPKKIDEQNLNLTLNQPTSAETPSLPGVPIGNLHPVMLGGLPNGNFASHPQNGGNQQPDLYEQIKRRMEVRNYSSAGQNQNFLAGSLAGNPMMSLALSGHGADAGLVSQLGLGQGKSQLHQNDKGNPPSGIMTDGNGQMHAGNGKETEIPNFSNLANLPGISNANEFSHGLNSSSTTVGAHQANLTGKQGNENNALAQSGLDPSIAAALLGNANAPNVQTSQPYMQTLQTLLQQHQQSQNQLLQLQTPKNPHTTSGILPSDLKATAPVIGSANESAIPNNRSSSNASDTYRDYSGVGDDGTDLTATQPPGKDPPFPVKLHRILSNPEYNDVVSWLPHGRSWRVLKPKAFEEKVIPLYFRHAKYASFMRQVNGWGFKRMTQGPDHNSYYHELFLRGMQHLCYKMRRPTRARVDTDPDFNPDFYRLSMVAPLPNQDVSNNNMTRLKHVNLNNMPKIGNNNMMSSIQHSAAGLSSLAGMNAMAGMNSLAGMHNPGAIGATDNSLSANFLQQQLAQNQNMNIGQQHSSLSQGFAQGMQGGGNGLMGIGNGNTELGQLESLRQRREELVRQLQTMVNSGNSNAIPNAALTAASTNTNGLMNNANNVANTTNLQNGLAMAGNIGNLLNTGIGSNTSAQLHQMMSLGMNGSPNGQHMMMSNSGPLGTNASVLNMNAMSNNLSNLGGMNQQLLMQNGVVGGGGLNPNMGLGNLGNVNNNMTIPQNLGAMLQANKLQNQLMGQQGNQNAPSSGRPHNYGDNNQSK